MMSSVLLLLVPYLCMVAAYSPSNDCTYPYRMGDCYGHDIRHEKLGRTACLDACTKTAACKSVQQRGNSCWLKNYVCSDGELTKISSGYAQFKKNCKPSDCTYVYRMGVCYGHDIRHEKLGRTACFDACTKTAACKSVQQRGNKCWLKNYVCSDGELASISSGYAQFTKYCRQ